MLLLLLVVVVVVEDDDEEVVDSTEAPAVSAAVVMLESAGLLDVEPVPEPNAATTFEAAASAVAWLALALALGTVELTVVEVVNEGAAALGSEGASSTLPLAAPADCSMHW